MSTSGLARLRLWQLISPTLPVGAFAWSDGLESAVDGGTVHDRRSAGAWIGGLLDGSIGRLDLPVLVRMLRAGGDESAFAALDDDLAARRETLELRASDAHLASALMRVLSGLPGCAAAQLRPPRTFAAAWAIASRRLGVSEDDAVAGYAWAWLENQVAAAIKLVPLGQTDGQRLLFELAQPVDDLATRLDELAALPPRACTPGLTIASSRHETQYSRLFRS